MSAKAQEFQAVETDAEADGAASASAVGGDGSMAAPASTHFASVPTTCIEHAYGSTYRLSFQIKVF